MKKIFCTLLLSVFMISSSFAGVVTKTYGDGFIEMIGDYPVLHVKGSEYEMGKQYGYLAGDRIAANVINLRQIGEAQEPRVKLVPDSIFTWLRKLVGMVFWITFPENVKTHIKGIVDGASEAGVKVNKYDIAFINSVIDIVGIAKANVGELPTKAAKEKAAQSEESWLLRVLGLHRFNHNCDSMAVWGSRTVDGKTFQTRNTDITTGVGIERYPLVIVYKPEGKIPFVTAAFSGMVGIFTGMNAYGVALGQVWAFSKDVKLATPWNISVRKFFAESTTAKEALVGFQKLGTTTYGNNFVVADAGGHQNSSETGYSIEMTGKRMAYFLENDAREFEVTFNGETYAYPINDGVYRGDVSFDPAIRARQLSADGPDGDPRQTGSYNNRYKGQYDKIVAFSDAGVLMGHKEAEYVSRETAMKNSSLQTAVYANTDRDMWVSYSKINDDGSVIQAYEREYVNIPFKDYLVDLKLMKGEVVLKNWYGSRNGLVLRHKGLNKENEILIDSIETGERIQTGVKLSRGETVELYDGNQLIDRLSL